MMGCRIHGEQCRTPWGWDAEHSDFSHPWTLADVDNPCHRPFRYAYFTVEEYVEAFHLHRVVQRDKRLTSAENSAAHRARLESQGNPHLLRCWQFAWAGDYEGLADYLLERVRQGAP